MCGTKAPGGCRRHRESPSSGACDLDLLPAAAFGQRPADEVRCAKPRVSGRTRGRRSVSPHRPALVGRQRASANTPQREREALLQRACAQTALPVTQDRCVGARGLGRGGTDLASRPHGSTTGIGGRSPHGARNNPPARKQPRCRETVHGQRRSVPLSEIVGKTGESKGLRRASPESPGSQNAPATSAEYEGASALAMANIRRN